MASTSEKVIQLRKLLAERFQAKEVAVARPYPTGLPLLDEVGLIEGSVTEVVCEAKAPGGGLLLYGLLHAVAQRGERVAIMDGATAFQPRALPPADLSRILWSQCHQAKESLQATDLAVRDGNFPLVILLLTLNPKTELRKIPATVWHRLRMLAEKSATTLLVFTPFAQIGCANLRLSVTGDFPLENLHSDRAELLASLKLQVERQRLSLR